ncbi:hypothetical protein [Pseudarcicella hirudinis]|uniref:hypothetical protein n=1 Tax=Pseudarcicella hirudinis TaxID=1079859 RepID=UPI001C432CFE|nr:hypothetical protein [Pseudarcicella hirudinis]
MKTNHTSLLFKEAINVFSQTIINHNPLNSSSLQNHQISVFSENRITSGLCLRHHT